MEKKIIVPTDGSEEMKTVLGIAMEIAKHLDAKIYGLYVVDLTPFIDFPEDELVQTLKSRLYEDGWNALRMMEKVCLENGCRIELMIEEGNPAERIIKIAKKLRADMIVMGTRRDVSDKYMPVFSGIDRIKGGFANIRAAVSRKLFGSTAEKVIEGAPCDVLAVPLMREE
ncbi:MAG: universal stress protein [Thermoplasmata archaeon]